MKQTHLPNFLLFCPFFAADSHKQSFGKQVLDFTCSAAISLNVLKKSKNSRVTLLLGADETGAEVPDTSRVHLVPDNLAGRVDAATDLAADDDDAFDAALVEAVESTGRMNEAVMSRLTQIRGHCRQVYPLKVSVFCQLVESCQVHGLFYVRDDTSLPGNITRVINRFATRHQQDLHLSSYKSKVLGDGPTHVTDLDLMKLGHDSFEKEFSIVTSSSQCEATAHLLLYWFEMDYGEGNKVATYCPDKADKSSHFKQSMISFKQPIAVVDEIKVTFLYKSGLIDFVLK